MSKLHKRDTDLTVMCNEQNDTKRADRKTDEYEYGSNYRKIDRRPTDKLGPKIVDKNSAGDLKVEIRFGKYMTWWHFSHLFGGSQRTFGASADIYKYHFMPEIQICICVSECMYLCE